jgi:uncharacterized Zn finger protein
VIDAVKATYPDWAFGACCKQAEEIINAKRSKDYDAAVSWLARARDVLVAAGKQTKWDAYLEGLITEHARKYKLMPLLRRL